MGRLDKAMRRAEQEGVGKSSVSALDPHEQVTDQFPSEEPSLPSLPSEPEHIEREEAFQTTSSAVVLAGEQAEPPTVSLPDMSIFEHIDSRLGSKTVVDDHMA